ncbi:sensor histidine kinase [Pelagibacterium montanilacus]|uniref:sensor histidine kinase n=1 Tax=Pelagibacterium montanilacus TaxID=2185280 RepID=UPI000F8EA53B|nr:histidine kinase dimerization/phosphoacceptor domain -containing protein [Pelagibacterium montanilacus]
MSKRHLNTATLAAAFAALLSVCIFVILAVVVSQAYRDQIARAEETAKSTAQVVAVHSRWVIEASVQSLERIYDRLEAGDFDTPTDTLNDISAAFDHLPGDVGIAVYGPGGNLRLSNIPEAEQANVSESAFFVALAQGQTLHISPFLTMSAGGAHAFVVARRLEQDGAFSGIATVTISNAMLSDFAQSLALDNGSTMSLVRDDGWLVARHPAPDTATSLANYELFTTHLVENPEEGTYVAQASPIDGVARTVAYRAVPGLPLIAVSAISTDAIVDRFWRNATLVLWLIGPIGIMLLIVAFLLWRAARRDQRTQERLSHALDRNQLLFREIHHRVKNNLQAISSLVQMQPIPAEAKQEMARRVAAMVAVHEHIYRHDQFERTEVSEYIDKLVRDIAASFHAEIALDIGVEPVVVHRDNAMPLGLIVNEVLSNAFKYAFRDREPGTIHVSLERIDADQAQLTISDDGVGFDPDAPSTGIGQRLIRGLAQQIGGTTTFSSADGTRFDLVFPLEPPAQEDEG